ncbi:hypothetical protein F0562_001183 [Nyssa sinensis]|uniref:Uncharacterized protein n=1 Tax=Nyssa sinensis TaxID=561372 RepID=A0A5J5C2V3_9ASTE|nr:hypothetical protein F0562_001183 [Nyssa sinensis]
MQVEKDGLQTNSGEYKVMGWPGSEVSRGTLNPDPNESGLNKFSRDTNLRTSSAQFSRLFFHYLLGLVGQGALKYQRL